MVKYQSADLDLVFSALGDATRRAILARLAEGESRVTELARPHDMSLPAISKHLRVLEQAGLVKKQKDGRVIRCSLDPAALKTAADWVDQYRRFWDERFDQLARYLEDTDPHTRNDT
ncbi:MAG: metalloregulator ArsR/SmtB family transcription factor [Alphaproteobacteria bacterium]|nr:metalloregulator ArsR/SmtB family transcription factor [Alphaproteobacteria bacterium]